MQYEAMNLEQAIEEGKQLPFAMLQTMSEVYIGKTPKEKLAKIPKTQIRELRFFDQKQEIRVCRNDGNLQGMKVTNTENETTIEKRYALLSEKFGKEVTVSYALFADEDGQMYVGDNRLLDWKG